jgi:peptide chain release factor 1
MFEKLAQIEKSYDELTEQISQPEFMSDMSVYAKLMKQHRSLGEVVEKYREVRRMQEELAGAKEMADAADDEEMRELALVEASEIEAKLPTAEEELKVLLLPRDPNDEKNVILEIRAGTGGDEATLFAAYRITSYDNPATSGMSAIRTRRLSHIASNLITENNTIATSITTIRNDVPQRGC